MSLNLDKSTWKRVEFGDIIESVTERVDNPSAAGVDRYVGLEHLDPGVMTVQRWDSPGRVEAQKLRFHPGDVIFGRRRAYQRKVARADFEGICSAHALVLRARPGRMHPDFLPVFLSSDYFLDRAIAISVGSLSPTVNWRDLRVEEFDLPALHEQERIADLLWAVERHLRELANRAAMLRSMEALVLSDAAAASDAEWVRLEKWIQRIEAGSSPRAANEPAGEGELGVLKVSAVGHGEFLALENKRLLATSDFRPEVSVSRGDVLVTRANAIVDNVARPCIVDADHPRLMLSDKTLRLVPAVGFPPRIILAALRAPAYRAHVREAVNGTEAKNISQQRILSGPVPDLDAHAIDRVSSRLSVIDAALAAARRETAVLETLKFSVLADIFGGA